MSLKSATKFSFQQWISVSCSSVENGDRRIDVFFQHDSPQNANFLPQQVQQGTQSAMQRG